MIDVGKIRDIYPNYQEGQDISPHVLIRSMIVLQNQESTLISNLIDASTQVDGLKLQLDRAQKEIDSLVELAVVRLQSSVNDPRYKQIPKDFLKNKESTNAYIKFGSEFAKEFSDLFNKKNKIEDELVVAKSLHKKYDSMATVVRNAVNTATQVLSYLKHEERMTSGPGNNF